MKLFAAQPAIDTTDMATAKAGLIGYLDGLLAGTGRMIAAFQAAGSPTIPDGEAVAKAVVGSMSAARGKMAEGRAELAGLDTTDPAAFEAAVTKVGEKLQAAVQLDPVDQSVPRRGQGVQHGTELPRPRGDADGRSADLLTSSPERVR